MSCVHVGKLHIVRMAILPKLTYSFINSIVITIPTGFFAETENDPNIHMEVQETQNSQNKLEEQQK